MHRSNLIIVSFLLLLYTSWAESRCQCGVEGSVNTNRIINGTLVPKGKYPWFVYTGCGAALITDRHVLTSAHCALKNVSEYVLGLGVHNTAEHHTSRRLEVESIIRHPEYNHQTHHDIAIMKLKEPVKFEDGLNPICLPDFDETDNVFAYGLGAQDNKTSFSFVSGDRDMHEVELNRLSYDDCSKKWNNNRHNVSFCTLQHGMSSGICFGDSGSPVSTRKDGRVYVVGLPAGTPGDCNHNNKTEKVWQQHEKVFAHLKWIRENTIDGLYCEAEHHPFAKPENNTVEVVEGNKQTCGQLKPGQSMDKPGRKPWEVFVDIESEAGYTTSTFGVLISDRHVLIGAKDLQYENTGKVKQVIRLEVVDDNGILYRDDVAENLEVKPDSLTVIQLPHQKTASFAVFELETPLDIESESSPYGVICLPTEDTKQSFDKTGVLTTIGYDGVARKAELEEWEKCKYHAYSYGDGDDVTLISKKTEICTKRLGDYTHDYLTATTGNKTFIAGFSNPRPWNQKFQKHHGWMSVSLAKEMIESIMTGVQILHSLRRGDDDVKVVKFEAK